MTTASQRPLAVRALALAAGLVVLLMVMALPAQAHAALVSSNPDADATLADEPTTVRLTFSENVASPAYVVVKAPDGTRLEVGKPQVVDQVVTQKVKSSGYAGNYAISYRVVSADGHPVEGTIGYHVSAGEQAKNSAAPVANGSFTNRHADHLLWGAAGIVAAGVLLLWPRRRKDESDAA